MHDTAFTVALFLVFTQILSAQTGPGGVGDGLNNGLWLRAETLQQANNSPVINWADVSGNGNNAGQPNGDFRPKYFASSLLNGMPTVRFDGANDRMIVPDADLLDGTNSITYYAVVRPTNLDELPRGILGKRVNSGTPDNTWAYTWYFHTGQRLNLDVNTQNDRFGTSESFANATNYILSWDFDGARAAAVRSRIYSGGATLISASETSTAINASPQPLILGALNDDYGNYLGADYAEVIHYNRSLRPLERRLVNNYLSGKYSIPLSTGDVYTQDNPASGNYDFDIAGIGRISAADRVDNARGSGLLRVSNPTDLGNDEHLVFGHDGNTLVFDSDPDLPPGVTSQLVRVWRTSEVALNGTAVDVGAVDLEFDLSELGTVPDNDIVLLVDTDNDGDFTDEVPIGGAVLVRESVYAFSGISALTDNTRFTLAQAEGGLPVELVALRATVEDQRVKIYWATARETLSDYFAVESLSGRESWTEIGRVTARGESRSLAEYTFYDSHERTTDRLYRLRQVDIDGYHEYSPTVLVRAASSNKLAAYPNPTGGWLNVPGNDGGSSVQVFNAQGQLQATFPGRSEGLDLSSMVAGKYLVTRGRKSTTVIKR